MGNREDLLAGAKKCLLDKGYARTTARDIAAAAGTSLAAIGYHFRTKDALLNEAVLDLTGTEFGNAFEKALRSTNATDGLAGFEAVWDQLIDALRQHRAVLAVSAETLGQIEHVPEIRAAYRAAQPHAIAALARVVREANSEIDEATAHTLASFYYTLFNGMFIAWLIDPTSAPTAADLSDALRAITAPKRRARKRTQD